MSTVAIIGAGEIGAACARALAAAERVRRIILIDEVAAAGKALDIQQSGPIDLFDARLEGTADLAAAIHADVCVIADRMSAPAGEWTGDAGLALVARLAPLASRAPLVFAGPHAATLMEQAVTELHIPRARLLGSAPAGLASAARALTALDAGCSATDVALGLVGSGTSFVIPWSQASIAGFGASSVLPQAAQARIEARVARLWPPGPETLGVAAARLVEGVAQSSRRTFTAFVVLDGELGVRGRVAALPVLVSGRGLAEVRLPPLSGREQVQLESALGH